MRVLIPALVSALALVSSARGEDLNSLVSKLGSKAGQANLVLRALPKEQRTGVEEFLSATGVRVLGSSNAGIDSFNSQLLRANPCLHTLARTFYEEISDHPPVVDQNHLTHGRLSEVTSEPGWFWRRALDFADGDKLLAMHLIGMCGHDDVSGGAPVNCPGGNHSMYLQQSLGAKYDIPASLKAKIAKVQAPTMGAQALPSKYYHVMGAAFTSCLLVRRGVPSFVDTVINKGAIHVYRTRRLCDDVAGLMNYTSCTPEKVLPIVMSYNRDGERCNGSDPCCSLALTFAYGRDELDPAKIKVKVATQIARNRALNLFKNSSAYKTSGECEGSALGAQVRNYFEQNSSFGDKNPCDQSWPAADCRAVRDVMSTFVVDFDWSEAQHKVGLEFAKDNCPRLAPGADPLAHACIASERAKGLYSGASAANRVKATK
jgi:hypothetical protein